MRGRRWCHRTLASLLLLTAVVAGVAPTASDAAQVSPNARASIDDASIGWGETTTVRGSGWAPGKPVTVTLFAGNTRLASTTAGADGSIAVTIRAPSGIASSNKYRLAVQGAAGDGAYGYVEVPLTIAGPTPIVSVADRELEWAQTTTVSGQRYKSGAAITVSLFPDNTVLARTNAVAGDTFSVPVEIPSNLRSSDKYQIVVTGQGIDLLFHFDAVEVTIVGERPTIALSTDSTVRGEDLTVSGQRFLAGSRAQITLVPGYERLADVTVLADGTFSREVTIPARAEGRDPHGVVVTGQGADGLFAYLVTELSLSFRPGEVTEGTRLDIDDTERPPDVGGSPATVRPAAPSSGGGIGGGFAIVLLLLGMLLLLALLLLSARRDVRRYVRQRRDALVRRLRLRRG